MDSFYMFMLIVAIILGIAYYLYRKAVMPVEIAKYFCIVEHYLKMPILMLGFFLGLRGTSYWSEVDDCVYLGALPTRFHVDQMVNKYKFKGVVNLCYEHVGHDTSYKAHGIEQLRLPTVDHYSPSLADTLTAVEFIQNTLIEVNEF